MRQMASRIGSSGQGHFRGEVAAQRRINSSETELNVVFAEIPMVSP